MADAEGLGRSPPGSSNSTKGHPAITLHHELGTSKGIVPVSVSGILPTYNFQDGSFDRAEADRRRDDEEDAERQDRDLFCLRRFLQALGGRRAGRFQGDPQISAARSTKPSACSAPTWAWIILRAVAACNELCNRLGLDTISTGATLSWAIECFERGLLNEGRYRRADSRVERSDHELSA